MKRTVIGLAQLSRFDEYSDFVVITTILGVLSGQGAFTWELIILLMANWLAVGFAYMINDIEDAPEDAFSTKNFQRNPVSSGVIAPKDAKIAAWLVAVTCAVLYIVLGMWPFILGAACLILGILFSAKTIRLKTIAFVDILSHGLIFAGLPFLCSFFTFTNRFNQVWIWPFIFVVSVSNYRRLQKEIRTLERERLSRSRHHAAYQGTATVLGDRVTSSLLLVMLILAVLTGVATFLIIDLIPTWVFVVIVFLMVVFMLPPLLRNPKGESAVRGQVMFIKPLERAAALALILQLLLPRLNQLLQLGIF